MTGTSGSSPGTVDNRPLIICTTSRSKSSPRYIPAPSPLRLSARPVSATFPQPSHKSACWNATSAAEPLQVIGSRQVSPAKPAETLLIPTTPSVSAMTRTSVYLAFIRCFERRDRLRSVPKIVFLARKYQWSPRIVSELRRRFAVDRKRLCPPPLSSVEKRNATQPFISSTPP